MSIFRKLFATYLLVTLLALLISGGFAGYLTWQAAGRSHVEQLERYTYELSSLLTNKDWGPDELDAFQSTADTLDRSDRAHVFLIDREGVVKVASRSVRDQAGTKMPMVMETRGPLRGGLPVRWLRPRPDGDRDPSRGASVTAPVMRSGQVVGAVLLRPALEPVQKIRYTLVNFILYGSLTAAVVLALVSLILSRRLAHPIAEVSQAVRRVAQGDFSSRVAWQSHDEVGRLAEDFNHMAGELAALELARKELIANVSHELKGPLARVSGYLEAISDGVGGEAAREQHFDVVRREVTRLTRLVNDLLDYSRLEVGRLKLHTFPVDLAPTLQKATQVFQGLSADAAIDLQATLPATLPPVECEPERIEQVLVNLLENAFGFTPRGGRVTVTAGVATGYLEVSVADTGPGIPAEELDRIFDRFYKLDPARTPDRRGFGLGLTIVRQLVELHGGQVFASSTVGRGSRFGFRLPLASPEA